MRKVLVLGVVGALAAAAPAQAEKPSKPPKPPKPPACVAHERGYNSSGTLVAAALAPAGHGRYSGTIQVDVTKASDHAPKGDQTFTLTKTKVKFHHGVSPAAPTAGSQVKLQGKIAALPKGCSTAEFTPAITINKVDISAPRHHPHHPVPPPHPTHPHHPSHPPSVTSHPATPPGSKKH